MTLGNGRRTIYQWDSAEYALTLTGDQLKAHANTGRTSMMKKAYIHIGLEKTGTTSLQIFMQENKEALKKNNIIYLGDDSKPYFHGIGHFPIVASFYHKSPNIVPAQKHRPPSEVLFALSQDSAIAKEDIILSCEHFSSRLLGRENIRALRDSLLDRSIKIICYLRPQDEQAVSLYSTLVKGGATDTFTITDVTPENRYFNYQSILEDWADVFGKDNIIIREYARDTLVGNDICTDFLSILGTDSEYFNIIEDQNISLDSLQVEMLRCINKHLTSFPWGKWDVDIPKFEQSQSIRVSLVPLLPKGMHISSLASYDDRSEVLNRFKEDNLKISKDFKGADFIVDWYEPKPSLCLLPAPSNPTPSDFEKALVASGLELNKKTSQIENLSSDNGVLRGERDTALKSLDEVEAAKFSLKKSLKKYRRKIKILIFPT
jgi:hypothetical protein